MCIKEKLNKLAKMIFSIDDNGYTHKIVRLLGIKIKFPKTEYAEKKRKNPYYYYKKHNIDITTLPPATGQIRAIQLANLVLLNELDYVCKCAGLKYWLDGGTLLGAVRHKGFIPWDDDIDTAMLREDYEKIIDSFKKYSRNPDIYADFHRSKINTCMYHIKVKHKKCSALFVDIFPWDDFGKKLTQKEQITLSKKLKKTRKILEKECTHSTSNEVVKNKIQTTMKEDFLTNQVSNNNKDCDYVWGLDYNHCWNNWFTHYDVLHPLKTIEFEGTQYPCMNKPKLFLERLYGNYLTYPEKIGFGHSMYLKIKKEDKDLIQKLINEQSN